MFRPGYFDLYYFEPGGTQLKTYSARGIISDFPSENTWIKMIEQEFYDQSTGAWSPWTYNNGEMWVKLNAAQDKMSVEVQLDMNPPADTAEYTWVFEKIDDSVDPWY